MNSAQLLTHFHRLAEAPDAIPRLRRFILDLAVRGKLVPQDSEDEPAAKLLQRIQAEKERLVKEGKIGRTKPCDPVGEDEVLFTIRPGWALARFCDVLTEIQTGPFGSSLHQSDYVKGGVPVVNPASIKNEKIVPVLSMAVGENTLERLSNFKLKAGDIVMARRGEMGRCAVVTEAEEGWLCGTGSLVLRLPWMMDADFVVLLIGSPLVRDHLGGSAVGATMQNLNQSILLGMAVFLPPLAEQRRIVAKVTELMGLCDRLEAAQADREQRRDRLGAATHAGLSTPEPQHSSFFLRHFPQFTTRPDQIPLLRQTILNLAVRGQLVEQDPKDEPAPSFGESIHVDDTHRLALEIPNGWSWAKVEDVAEARLGKMLDKAKNKGRSYRYLGNANVQWFEIRISDLKEIKIEDAEFEKYTLRDGDVLICEGGQAGRTAVWRSPDTDITFQKALHRVRPSEALNSDFFAMCMSTYYHSGVLQSYYTGIGIPHFTGASLAKLVFPLPPLAEQRRIVAKVEELMALCDQMEKQLHRTQTESRRLLASVLHEALDA